MTMYNKLSQTLLCIILLSLYLLSEAIESDQRPIYARLKSDISSARSRGQNDPQLLQAVAQLDQIASLRPLIQVPSGRAYSLQKAALSAHRLDKYYQITPDQLVGKNQDDIVAALLNNPLVESAQVEPVAFPAGFRGFNQSEYHSRSSIPDYTNCDGYSFTRCQKYMLEPEGQNGWKMGGLNGFKAQQMANNLGENVRIIVMEIGHPVWDHIDLKQPFLSIGEVDIDDHSTASAGIMIGQANGVGVTGFVPKAEVGYAKWGVDRLIELSGHLQAGDVIQIGVQYGMGSNFPYCMNKQCWVPVETVDLVQDTISYLTKELGVHVIMAAANGNVDLDHPAHNGRYSRARDSGGIYAGACDALRGIRSSFSDYGSRVDLFSFGDSVTTTAWKAGRNDLFQTGFSGTSSANPILAGATALIQSVARARGIGNIDPFIMRQLLVDSGRPITYPDSKNIGKQPDLVKALELLDQLSGNPSSTSTKSTSTKSTSTKSTSTKSTSSTRSTSTSSNGVDCQGVSSWQSGQIYDVKGEEVVQDKKVYRQSYWNRGQQPDRFNGVGQPWELIKSCSGNGNGGNGNGNQQCNGIPNWDSTKRYTVYGEKVAYNSKVYMVNFQSNGQSPDQHSAPWGQPWIPVKDC